MTDRPALRDHCAAVLGTTPAAQARALLLAPWARSSFSGFWRAWNPVWSYPLRFFVYPVARRRLKRPAAVVVTFATSGILHDALLWVIAGRPMFPAVTVFLGVCGLISAASDRLPWPSPRNAPVVRVAVNATLLMVAAAATWAARLAS